MRSWFIALLIGLGIACHLPAQEIPATGAMPPELAAYDRVLLAFMRKWHVPGMAVAVTRQGRLVLARGYGWADCEERRPVQPDSLFRIASVSKPITAAAVLVLVERGQLALDDRVLDRIGDLAPQAGGQRDPRWSAITLRQLLHHQAGFDHRVSGDPMFRLEEVARALDTSSPPAADQIIRWMLGRPLDFDPGERCVYSNFGYCLLGHVVQHAAEMPYADAVRQLVLEPCAIRGMRPGRSPANQRAEGEVCYYEPAGSAKTTSVFAADTEPVPWPYGGFAIEPANASGGWLASAVDLVRFATAAAGTRATGLWKPETRTLVAERLGHDLSEGDRAWYGLGWCIRPAGDGANWWHTGSLPGTLALVVHSHDAMAWAALVNTRPGDSKATAGELDHAFWAAKEATAAWPETDLFNPASAERRF